MLVSSVWKRPFQPTLSLLQFVFTVRPDSLRRTEPREGRGRLDRQSARAIECLAHAIEYLEDTRPFSPEPTPRLAAIEESVALLKARNREVFFACSTQSQRNAVIAWD